MGHRIDILNDFDPGDSRVGGAIYSVDASRAPSIGQIREDDVIMAQIARRSIGELSPDRRLRLNVRIKKQCGGQTAKSEQVA